MNSFINPLWLHPLVAGLLLTAVGGASPQPVPRLVSAGAVDLLTCDGESLYWSAASKIMTIATPGGHPEMFAEVSAEDGVSAFAADKDNLLLAAIVGTNQSLLYRVDKRQRQFTVLAHLDYEVRALASDAQAAYWLRPQRPDSGGAVMAVSETGGDPRMLADAVGEPWSIGVDGEFVYFTTIGSAFSNPLGRPDGTIVKVAKSGTPPSVLFFGQYEPENLVVTDKRLFWSDALAARGAGKSSGVWSGDRGGGRAKKLGTVDDVITGMTVANDTLFIAVPGNARTESEAAPEHSRETRGYIGMLATAGGRRQRLVNQSFARPRGIVFCQNTLFWQDGSGVWALPAPNQ